MEERPVREVAGCDLDLHQVGESIAARYGQTPHARREAKLHHSLSTLNLTTKTPTGAKEDDEGSGSRSPRGGHHRIRTPAPRREPGRGERGGGAIWRERQCGDRRRCAGAMMMAAAAETALTGGCSRRRRQCRICGLARSAVGGDQASAGEERWRRAGRLTSAPPSAMEEIERERESGVGFGVCCFVELLLFPFSGFDMEELG